MSTKTMTGTAMLLAVALLAQSLRLLIPIPPQVSMFVIGSIVSATIVLAAWRFGLKAGLLIAWVTPLVAYLQGLMLPLAPAVIVVGLGSSLYATVAYALRQRPKVVMVVLAVLVRVLVLYGGFSLLLQLVHLPMEKASVLLFSMGWPQIVTGSLGILLASVIQGRLVKH